jgi:hypothetical protein
MTLPPASSIGADRVPEVERSELDLSCEIEDEERGLVSGEGTEKIGNGLFVATRWKGHWMAIFLCYSCLLCALALIPAIVLAVRCGVERLEELYCQGERSCSRFGQDRFVLASFPEGHRGSFLDLGAHDGTVFSSTLMLEQKGWTGMCVEPIPIHFRRRTCHLVRAVVSDVPGEVVEFDDCSEFGDDKAFGQMTGEPRAKPAKECREESFTTTTLKSLLLEGTYKFAGSIDFVSMGIQHSTMKALKTFPFASLCVRLWSIQAEKREHEKIMVLLGEGGGRNCTQRHDGPGWGLLWVECECPSG